MTKKIQRAWFYTRPHTKPHIREAGPHGVTLIMRELQKTLGPKSYPYKKEPRDRSLRGKQRRLARKLLQRRPVSSPQDW